jgi:putative DNA primase/helicase
MENYKKAPQQMTPNNNHYLPHYTAKQILDKARGQWPSILESLGINTSFLKNKHGPCPICGGKDRFRFDNKDQKGTFYCNRCGSGDGIKLLQLYRGYDFAKALNVLAVLFGEPPRERYYITKPKHISSMLNKVELIQQQIDIEKRNKSLNMVWSQSKTLTTGDPVDCYLRARGIVLSCFPTVLRFHPQLPYFNDGELIGRFPAMLALIQDKDNHGITIHRTYLGIGCKANVPCPKKIMSPITPGASSGAAIKFHEPIEGKLGLAEGIESALTLCVSTQFPVWATVTAGGMEKVTLPQRLTEVLIAVDNDASGRGQKAADFISQRLLRSGCSVRRIMSPIVGQDINDVLLGVGL